MRLVAKNTAYLTVANLVGYVIPILEVPILARVLGPTSYGQLVLLQSIALLTSVIVEYGFNLSSAQDVARVGDDKHKLSGIFSDVLLAKLLLTMGAAICLLIFWSVGIKSFGPVNPAHIVWGVLYFLGFAFSPFWYFLGRERVGGIIAFELFLRLTCLVLLYFLVKGPNDVGLALALMSLTSFSNTVVTNAIALRSLPALRLRFSGAVDAIRAGFNVFVYRSSNTVLVTAAPAMIGALVDRAAVGIFAPAEKVVRGVVGLSTPVFTAAFPYFSRAMSAVDKKSYGAAWAVIGVSVALGCIFAISLFFLGPPLILFVIGHEFTATADLMRWFVWLIPLRIVNQALGLVILIPSGKAKQTSQAMVFFSVLSLIIAWMLLEQFQALGMVLALGMSELGLAAVLLFLALQKSVEFTAGTREP
jgi:PST family polysaccharide transporter